MKYKNGDVNQKSFFEVIEEGEEGKCKTLWLSVILQQVLDAKGKFGNTLTQAQARIWLEGRGGIHSGLYEVCSCAGVDFEKTRKRCAELLKDDAATVDFRMNKRDKEENQTAQNRRRYYRRIEKREVRRQNHRNEFMYPHVIEGDNENYPTPANDNQPGSKAMRSSTENK